MKRRGMAAVALWVALLVVCVVVISRASFTADLSAFLPRTPTAEQQVLVDQLKEGAISRLILIGIDGARRRDAGAAVAGDGEALGRHAGVHAGEQRRIFGARNAIATSCSTSGIC